MFIVTDPPPTHTHPLNATTVSEISIFGDTSGMIRVKAADLSLRLRVAMWGRRAELRTSGTRGEAGPDRGRARVVARHKYLDVVHVGLTVYGGGAG